MIYSGVGWVDYLIDGSQVRGPVGVQTRSEATLRPWRSLLTTHTREGKSEWLGLQS